MEFLGIKLAPLRVPFDRRLQMLFIATGSSVTLLLLLGSWIITLYFLIFGYWARYMVLLYFCFMYYDWDTYKRGGRSEQWTSWIRDNKMWRHCSAYFPVKCVKTVELDPSKNYLLCSFPHGIAAGGVFLAFQVNGLDYKNLLPGLETRLIVLDQHFKVPLLREIAYCAGFCGAASESLQYLLREKNEGEKNVAAILLVGGAAEALKTRPSTYNIVLKRRKGFIRLALRTGTPLVPCFSFGENDMYELLHPQEGSLLHRVQNLIKRFTGMAPVIFNGRGIFQYTFGLLPRRTPITVVVGKPLEVPKIPNPSQEQTDYYHQKFVDHLIELFEREKYKNVQNPKNIKLVIE